MRHTLIFLVTAIILISCGSTKQFSTNTYGSPNVNQELLNNLTFKIKYYATDQTYGYTEKNPIMVGGKSEGPKNERRFLNAISGPNGEEIQYYRIGSCCDFKTRNSPFGGTGLLDMYNITYKGLNKDLVIYINMYDSDTLKVPVGFKLK
jgi:hypothetical protein